MVCRMTHQKTVPIYFYIGTAYRLYAAAAILFCNVLLLSVPGYRLIARVPASFAFVLFPIGSSAYQVIAFTLCSEPFTPCKIRLSKLNCTLDSPFTFHFLSACYAFS